MAVKAKVVEHTEPPDLNKDLNASATRITELRAGRDLRDIPLNDEFWVALNKHRHAFGGKI